MASCIRVRSLTVAALFVGGLFGMAMAQAPQSRVLGPIDEAKATTLLGNVHPMARAEFDQGPASAEMRLERMVLVLEPSAAQQAELDALVAAQHDPESGLYHQWLTPAEYGARFGVSGQDMARVTSWLRGHGFQIEEIPASNRLVLFSGTAGQVEDTFHTAIHRYQVDGVEHIANVQDPQIPAALAGVVGGVVSLHDFRRSSAIVSRREVASPQYSSGSTHYLFPTDWATIYDLNSLYSAGTTGAGTSIAIVGRSNITVADVTNFRSQTGLPANDPTVIVTGANPGLVSGDQDESTLDVEWSGAVATGATIKFVVSESTATSDGIDLSAQYIVNNKTAPVMSTSYGSCEQSMGAAGMAFYNSLWQQAASEGISSFVSSGDSGAAGCYGGGSSTASGAGVNGLCSSPYSTCVGGTEFNEGSNPLQYWSAANNANYESALGYIPEEVWNESGSNGGAGLWASGGGASVTFAQPAWQKGVSGTSAANGMRAVPDVAMSAAGHDGYIIVENGGFWVIAGTSAASPSFAGVMSLVVQSKGGTGQGNANATLYPLLNAANNPFHATPSGNNSVPGVTGFTASGAQYNLATGLGSVDGAVLVSSWPGATLPISTDFSLTASATSGSVTAGKSTTFTVSVTESGTGKNAIALTASAPTGVTVSISPASITPGASATVTVTAGSTTAAGMQNVTITGKDASGAKSLTYALTVIGPPMLTLTGASNPLAVSLVQGASSTVSLTAVTGGSYTGNITYSITGLPTGVTAKWSVNPVTTAAGTSQSSETLTLTATSTTAIATSTLKISAAGDGLTSNVNATLQVQPAPAVQLSVTPGSVSMQSLSSVTATFVATPVGGMTVPSGAAGSSISVASGLPKGVTASFSAASLSSGGTVGWTLTLTGSATAMAGVSTLGVTAKVAGQNGTLYTASQNLTLTVTLTPPALTVTPIAASVVVYQGGNTPNAITVARNGTFSGAATMSVSGLPSGVTASWSANPVTLTAESGSSTLTLAATSTAALSTATITVTATGDGVSASSKISVAVQVAPGFTLAATPSSVSMQSLASTTATFVATPVGGAVVATGATGSSIGVTSGLPKGVTAAFSAASANSNGTAGWTLTLTGSATAVAGVSTLGVTAKVAGKNGVVYTAIQNLTLTVTLTPPTLTVAMSNAATAGAAVTVVQGSTATQTVTLTGNATYSGAATLSVSGLPAGVTASWSKNPVTLTSETGSATLTLTASATASVGAATITVTATGDGVSGSAKLAVQVQQAPAVQLTLGSSTLTMKHTVASSVSVTVTPVGGLSGAVNLTVSGLPAGVTAAFSKPTLASPGAGSVTLTLTGSSTAKAGTTAVTISATTTEANKSYSATQTLSLILQ